MTLLKIKMGFIVIMMMSMVCKQSVLGVEKQTEHTSKQSVLGVEKQENRLGEVWIVV